MCLYTRRVYPGTTFLQGEMFYRGKCFGETCLSHVFTRVAVSVLECVVA